MYVPRFIYKNNKKLKEKEMIINTLWWKGSWLAQLVDPTILDLGVGRLLKNKNIF